MHQQWIPHTRRTNITHLLIADIVKTSPLSLSLSTQVINISGTGCCPIKLHPFGLKGKTLSCSGQRNWILSAAETWHLRDCMLKVKYQHSFYHGFILHQVLFVSYLLFLSPTATHMSMVIKMYYGCLKCSAWSKLMPYSRVRLFKLTFINGWGF